MLRGQIRAPGALPGAPRTLGARRLGRGAGVHAPSGGPRPHRHWIGPGAAAMNVAGPNPGPWHACGRPTHAGRTPLGPRPRRARTFSRTSPPPPPDWIRRSGHECCGAKSGPMARFWAPRPRWPHAAWAATPSCTHLLGDLPPRRHRIVPGAAAMNVAGPNQGPWRASGRPAHAGRTPLGPQRPRARTFWGPSPAPPLYWARCSGYECCGANSGPLARLWAPRPRWPHAAWAATPACTHLLGALPPGAAGSGGARRHQILLC